MERYRPNEQNLFNQTFKKIANQTVQFLQLPITGNIANLLPSINVARPATGSGRLEKVLWESLPIKIY